MTNCLLKILVSVSDKPECDESTHVSNSNIVLNIFCALLFKKHTTLAVALTKHFDLHWGFSYVFLRFTQHAFNSFPADRWGKCSVKIIQYEKTKTITCQRLSKPSLNTNLVKQLEWLSQWGINCLRVSLKIIIYSVFCEDYTCFPLVWAEQDCGDCASFYESK